MDVNVILVIGLVGLLVLGINGILYLLLRDNKQNQHIQLWRKAFKTSRAPWKQEEDALKELSDIVAQFKEPEEQGENDPG